MRPLRDETKRTLRHHAQPAVRPVEEQPPLKCRHLPDGAVDGHIPQRPGLFQFGVPAEQLVISVISRARPSGRS
jgi:hypothetical protein